MMDKSSTLMALRKSWITLLKFPSFISINHADDVIQSCLSLGDSMGQIYPYLSILHYFFELFYVLAGVSFDGVQPLCHLVVSFY